MCAAVAAAADDDDDDDDDDDEKYKRTINGVWYDDLTKKNKKIMHLSNDLNKSLSNKKMKRSYNPSQPSRIIIYR